MKNIRYLLITWLIMCFTVNCYAGKIDLKASPEYQGLTTVEIDIDYLGEYDCTDLSSIINLREDYASLFQVCNYDKLMYVKQVFDIKGLKFAYSDFENSYLLISFGAKIDSIKCYNGKGSSFSPSRKYSYIAAYNTNTDMNKVYAYKMDKIKFTVPNLPNAPIGLVIRDNAQCVKKKEAVDEPYTEISLTLVKSGYCRKNFLYDYFYISDANGNMPQLGELFAVRSNAEYEKYDAMFGLPDFTYTKYKQKCIVVSLGCELQGLKIYDGKVEPVITGNYVNNGVFIYEIDYNNQNINRQLFAINKDVEKLLPEGFLQEANYYLR